MHRKWINSVGLPPNWHPIVTDRICSDHFENDDILKINNGYCLKNDAIPLIKPQVYY